MTAIDEEVERHARLRDEHQTIAASKGWPFVDLDAPGVVPQPEAVALLEARLARQHNVLPLSVSERNQVVLAVEDPNDLTLTEQLRPLLQGYTMRVVYANKTAIRRLVDNVYSAAGEANAVAAASGRNRTHVADAGGDLGRVVGSDASDAARLLSLIIEQGLREKASDIHIEPREHDFVVRYRVDGRLHVSGAYPKSQERQVVTKIKVDAEMRSDNFFRPDSGVLQYPMPGRPPVDIRVEVTPTAWGSGAVMRLQQDIWLDMKDLGFSPENERRFRVALSQPQGCILLTGPTGSGKRQPLSTPIPTPTGTTTIGELQINDQVIGRDGKPCLVTHLWPVEEKPNLFRVHLSDGQVVLADAEHQWLVSDHHNRAVPRTKKRQASVARYEAAISDAEAIEHLAETWDVNAECTLTELLSIMKSIKMAGVGAEYQSLQLTLWKALRLNDCPKRRTEYYPTGVALKTIALRIRQRFSQRPSGDALLYRVTTEEMLDRGIRLAQGHARFSLPVAKSLDLKTADLPVAPYVLGYWLGDGDTNGSRLTVSAEDHAHTVDELRKHYPAITTSWTGGLVRLSLGRSGDPTRCLGDHDPSNWRTPVNAARYCVSCRTEDKGIDRPNRSLAARLRELGVIGHKRIPMVYLRGSHEQRLDLLRGLMDSDGTVDANGSCELALSERDLAQDALNLIRSLGIGASINWDRPTSYRSEKTGELIRGKNSHRIHFTTGLQVFTLPRKAERLAGKIAGDIRETTKWLYVTDITKVEAEDPAYEAARCISVDSPDHTYLCGDGYVVTSNTTTLYAAVNEKRAKDYKIITLENPIEYKVDEFVEQIQINPAQGMTFPEGVRSILRRDPDAILVGEVRDAETAEAAIDAAMTGHLVFSTLHTNDAPGAIPRFMRMGIDPFLVGSAMLAVVGQRLVRKLCPNCKTQSLISKEEVQQAGFRTDDIPDVGLLIYTANPNGCDQCKDGCSGRVPIHEVMLFNEALTNAVVDGAPQSEIAKLARANGMSTMREDGWEKVKRGETSLYELNKITATELV